MDTTEIDIFSVSETVVNKKKIKPFFFFLSPDRSALISSIIMMGVCIGTFFLNTMIYDQFSNFVLYSSVIFTIGIVIVDGIFITCLFIEKNIFHKEAVTGFAIYILFCIACYICNILLLICAEFLRDEYNLFNYYTDAFVSEHPESEMTFDERKHSYKLKYFGLSFVHLLVLIILLYYYYTIKEYIIDKQSRNDLYGRHLVDGLRLSVEKFKKSSRNNFYNTFNTSMSSSISNLA